MRCLKSVIDSTQKGGGEVRNLRGETNTIRSGLVYELDGQSHLPIPLTVKAYYFYATIYRRVRRRCNLWWRAR